LRTMGRTASCAVPSSGTSRSASNGVFDRTRIRKL
jgi:hypothetical protein